MVSRHLSLSFKERICFHNTGPSAVPGVIVMSIEDGHEGVPGLSQLDSKWVEKFRCLFVFLLMVIWIIELLPLILLSYSYIVVIFNSSPTEVSFVSAALQGKNLQLHPIQVAYILPNENLRIGLEIVLGQNNIWWNDSNFYKVRDLN